jgi:hypothetical protein
VIADLESDVTVGAEVIACVAKKVEVLACIKAVPKLYDCFK